MHLPTASAIIELPIDASAILVKAGPGSGKTRVLCDRIVHLVNNGVDPRQITAVTFTQLAAAELRKRIEQTAVDVWTGTFHGYVLIFRARSELGFSGDQFGCSTRTANVLRSGTPITGHRAIDAMNIAPSKSPT
ncbi:MAG: UvrD-helicase domain-containing protein [Thermomicrobiales bacterium]